MKKPNGFTFRTLTFSFLVREACGIQMYLSCLLSYGKWSIQERSDITISKARWWLIALLLPWEPASCCYYHGRLSFGFPASTNKTHIGTEASVIQISCCLQHLASLTYMQNRKRKTSYLI